MASETQAQPRPYPPLEVWPPDDTEESVVGTDLHQTTIINLRWGINEVAQLHRAPEQAAPWHALGQTTLLGCQRPDGTAYRTLPDVFVYPRSIDQSRGSVALALDGPPVLIIEVLSESTYAADIDLAHGKGYSYARAGVREYLALDPARAFIAEGGRGWRLVEGVYRPWEPDADGRWQSTTIEVAIGLEGVLAAIYTCEGRRMLREGEVEEELGRLRGELERMQRLLDERQKGPE